jgi:hypothetical protein
MRIVAFDMSDYHSATNTDPVFTVSQRREVNLSALHNRGLGENLE